MAFEIFPQAITLYPGDKQLFTLRNNPPPVIWSSADGTVQADGSIEFSAPFTGAALVLPNVRAGIAGIRWTFDSRMLPSGVGNLVLRLAASGPSLQVTVTASATVVRDYLNNIIATIAQTLAAGDVYYLEASGNAVRLYINDLLSAESIAPVPTTYPFFAEIEYNTPFVSGAPHILPPDLVGTWEIDPESAINSGWSAGGAAALAPAINSVQALYTAGLAPGAYDILCTVAGSALQTARARIAIAPLSILGERVLTVRPGEKIRIPTNYDQAQGKIVSWSVVSGGGSFANGEFEAPTAPGISVVRATSGNQRAEAVIQIPAVVTPSVTAAGLGEVVTFTTNMPGTVNWTADLGAPGAGSGATFLWTAPSQSQLVALITATNGTFLKILELPVLKVFPFDNPSLPLPWDRQKTVLVSRAEDRTRASRVKDWAGLAFESFELTFRNRTVADLQAVHDFWDEHYPQKSFIFEDRLRQIRKVLFFDSNIRQEGNTRCGINISFRASEA